VFTMQNSIGFSTWGGGGMRRREKLSSIAAAVIFAALCSATNALPVVAQEPPAAVAAVPQAGAFLLTVFLRPDENGRSDKRAPETDRLVRQVPARRRRHRGLVRYDGHRPGRHFVRARRKAARYEPRHRADRLGRLSNRVLPDLRFQAAMGRGPAPSSLNPPAPKS